MNNNKKDDDSKTGLDNRQAMVSSAIRELVGKQPQSDAIYRTITACNGERGSRAAGKGLQESWDKALFKQRLETNAKENSVWIDDIASISDNSAKFENGYENINISSYPTNLTASILNHYLAKHYFLFP